MVGRSQPRESKKLRGGVAIYKKSDSTLNLKVICDSLYDMVIVEIEDTSSVIAAVYIPPNNTVYYADIYFENLRLIIDTFIEAKDLYIFGDLNSRLGNAFPNQGFTYRINPADYCNQNGKYLINILKEYKGIIVINGILYKNRTMDSKYSLIRSSGSSQIDLAICNNVERVHSFEINDKLPHSDHCPCTIIILLDLDPPISIINECACTFKTYDHYDVDKRIRNAINIHRLNLITLEPALNILGENILNKYQNINPSKEMINKFTSELTSGLYNCCIDNYFHVDQIRREPLQQNCNSENFKAIAEAHKRRYIDLDGVNSDLAFRHKVEWLFYQGVAWQKEQEEIIKYKNEKWFIYNKHDPKKLWKLLDWKGEVKKIFPAHLTLFIHTLKKIFLIRKKQKATQRW